jgi:hypothetical protein
MPEDECDADGVTEEIADGTLEDVAGGLPGTLGQGVLINEPAGTLEFGPNPLPAP